jgi:hypothetical protein
MKFAIVNGVVVAQPDVDDLGQDIPINVGSPAQFDPCAVPKNSFRRSGSDPDYWEAVVGFGKALTQLANAQQQEGLKTYDPSSIKEPIFARSE